MDGQYKRVAEHVRSGHMERWRPLVYVAEAETCGDPDNPYPHRAAGYIATRADKCVGYRLKGETGRTVQKILKDEAGRAKSAEVQVR